MPIHSNASDYSRYFSLRQKVYLVKMSEERDSDVYESLSGVVTSSKVDMVELMVTYGAHDEAGSTTFKLTSEAFGSGIQVLAELTGVAGGNLFQFRMHGAMEMFQRRVVPRIELTAPIFQLCRNSTLTIFKKEWKRVMGQFKDNGALPGLTLKETEINLSAVGIGFTVDATNRPTPISMFFVTVDDGLPVCALAEMVWEQRVEEVLRCGFRFIHILKADQERINNCISELQRQRGGTHLDYKRNWVLVDKMVSDMRKPG